MLTEPSTVFFETGEIASFSKADGSVSTPTRGFLEAADTERSTGETTRQFNSWHFTAPSSDAAGYGEGDKVTIGETDPTEYTILDIAAQDTTQTTFLLEEP